MMFAYSVLASFVLLAIANVIAYRSKHPGWLIFGLCSATMIVPAYLGLFVPIAVLLALFLLPTLWIWRSSGRGPASFRSLSMGAALIALLISGARTLSEAWTYQRLRALYPLVSVEGRLSHAMPTSHRPPGAAAESRMSRIEHESRLIETHALHFSGGGIRTIRLLRLHDREVDHFVNSLGFGVARISPEPTAANLAGDLTPTPAQPGPRVGFSTSPGDWMPVSAELEKSLDPLHDRGLYDFVDPRETGYVEEFRRVAGFQPHRFRHVPYQEKSIQLLTLDLVGLLLYPEPRVYVSDRLPSMENVGAVPTRPLDKFESAGLAALREGDDLWIARDGETTRMLGGIRSLKQCIACHSGERGDLLGAFSYTLRIIEEPDRRN